LLRTGQNKAALRQSSAKGAGVISSLGQRPRLREIKTASAESAIHFPWPLRRAFSACLRNDLNPGALPQA